MTPNHHFTAAMQAAKAVKGTFGQLHYQLTRRVCAELRAGLKTKPRGA